MYNDFNKAYNFLVDNNYFTDDELRLVTNINGSNLDVLNDCIFARYGYRDIDQLIDEYAEV